MASFIAIPSSIPLPIISPASSPEASPTQWEPPADYRDAEAQQAENYGDSSDRLWMIYMTEAEKDSKQTTENWNAEADRILLFTGLFSTVVASFVIASYQNLSPNPSDTTNALLTQILISQQLVNNSHGTILATQSNQPFKASASAVRVNVMWSLSLVISLNCALYATLMQQWARQYQELAQRRGTPHLRARIRAFIFDGFRKFGFLARAVTPITTLLHISVFLFFAGLVEFLIPIDTTVAWTTLSCIGVFALPYAILTILPTISLQFPFGTPLSGITWHLSQRSFYGIFRVIRGIEGQFHGFLLCLWSWTHREATGPLGPTKWRETLDNQVEKHHRWFSVGLRKSFALIATGAPPTLDAQALEWTLVALEENKAIEDFVASIPGFFDSLTVPDPASAILPLLSGSLSTNPILGTRLSDLLETCIPGTSQLTEDNRNRRLRVCLKSLWYCGKAFDQQREIEPLPSYFRVVFASPDMTHRIRSEQDLAACIIGRCFGALVVKKISADIKSRRVQVSSSILTCLSAILDTEDPEVMSLLGQTGAIELANIISLMSVDTDTLVGDVILSDVLDVFKQTLQILSRSLFRSYASLWPPQAQVAQFYEIYSKVPHWLKFELQEIWDGLPPLSSYAPGGMSFPEPEPTRGSSANISHVSQ